MKYSKNPAMIYDSIFYLGTFYNKDRDSANSKSSEPSDLSAKLSASIKKEPPALLAPLFRYTNSGMSALSFFFSQNIDCENETFDSFIEKLRLRSDIFYRNALDHIFGEYENSSGNKVVPTISPSGYFAAIDELDASPEFKLQTALLFGNFAYSVEMLIETLRTVYAGVEKFYNEYSDILAKKYDSICADESLELLAEKIKYDRSRSDSTIVSVTLLNQSLVYADEISDNVFLMLGLRYEDFFADSAYEGDAGLADFIIACGSEIRMKMLQGLAKKKEMTLSEFAKYVGSQPTTVIRNLRMLEDNGILCVSRREAQQIFYKINVELLKRVRISFDRFVDELIK